MTIHEIRQLIELDRFTGMARPIVPDLCTRLERAMALLERLMKHDPGYVEFHEVREDVTAFLAGEVAK